MKHIVIAVIVFVQVYYYSCAELGHMLTDSGGYIDFDPDYGVRMFGYPFFIDIFQWLLGEHFVIGVIASQMLVFFLTLPFLYSIIMTVSGGRKRLALIVTMFYGCSTTLLQWNVMIMTESFSISLTVFFIYFAIRWLREYRKRDAFLLLLVCWLATIVKTALFIYTGAVVLLLILVFFFKKEKRKAVGFAMIFAVLIGIFDLGYCAYNYRHCGLFSMSNLTSRHKLVHALRSGNYLNYPDEELVAEIDRIYREHDYVYNYDCTTPIMELFGDSWQEQNQGTLAYARWCLRSDPVSYLKDLIVVGIDGALWKFRAPYVPVDPPGAAGELLLKLINLCFNIVRVGYMEIISLVSLVVTIRKWIREKVCPFEWLGMTGGMLMVLISVNLAAYSEWTRLTVYAMPFLYVDAAMLIHLFLSSRKKKAVVAV